MNKILKSIFIVTLIISFLLATVTVVILRSNAIKDDKIQIGCNAVKYLYQFNKVENLDSNMKKLKKITTDSVYNQLTVDNEERTLNTYLKFKGESTDVNIIKATDSYILYSLDNTSVEPDRIFIFMYNVNSDKKIDYVRECECLDFLKYY